MPLTIQIATFSLSTSRILQLGARIAYSSQPPWRLRKFNCIPDFDRCRDEQPETRDFVSMVRMLPLLNRTDFTCCRAIKADRIARLNAFNRRRNRDHCATPSNRGSRLDGIHIAFPLILCLVKNRTV
ncbi:hypothetical protein BWK52_0112c [Lacticaseibacillus paracasei]|nr:hypothetical protein BWK52_0112c [Lacticaseibacillus paracasei]